MQLYAFAVIQGLPASSQAQGMRYPSPHPSQGGMKGTSLGNKISAMTFVDTVGASFLLFEDVSLADKNWIAEEAMFSQTTKINEQTQ